MAQWSATVTLDAIDVSSQLVGRVRVEAEESKARIAQLSIRPALGVMDVEAWMGKTVVITATGDYPGQIFTGKVNLPVYDVATGLLTLNCSDLLQEVFETMSEATILSTITGGRYHRAVFGDRETGFEQFLDVLDTVPKEYHLDRNGAGVLANWAAGAADFSYTVSQVLEGRIGVERARRRDLLNKITLTFEYRFTRLHHREHDYTWLWDSIDFCDWFADTYTLPTREMIESAARQAGWGIQSFTFTGLPPTDNYNCGGQVFWSIDEDIRASLVLSAGWTAVRRWSQTVTETYTVTISSSAAITRYGEIAGEDGASLHTEYSDDGFDASTETDTPAWGTDPLGDYVEDQDDRTESDDAILTLMNVAATKLQKEHRRNFCNFRVALEPTLDLANTVSVVVPEITATGKVYKFVHELDFDRGTAITEITTAHSRGGAGSSDSLTAPTRPDTAPVHAPPSGSTVLPTRIGNDDTVLDFDANWTGYTGNYSAAKGSPSPQQIYQRRFRVLTAAIEDEVRNEVTGSVTPSYNVAIPDDTLTETVV